MIAMLTGNIAELGKGQLTLLVGGVGYQVAMPERLLENLSLGEPLRLYVHTALREDAILLYGFADALEREFFKLLLSVTGVGPKVALNLLSVLPPATLAAAILEQNTALLSKAPGVGRKLAERLQLELAEKVSKAFAELPPPEELPKVGAEVAEFLVSLGARPADAKRAVEDALAGPEGKQADFEKLLSLCLARLEGKRP